MSPFFTYITAVTDYGFGVVHMKFSERLSDYEIKMTL